ncbi:YncE family protein [Candidatus Bathyarchaeota archaeon]|nr:YncE family protein [Candidatus Bathyarchaeota archaeon]
MKMIQRTTSLFLLAIIILATSNFLTQIPNQNDVDGIIDAKPFDIAKPPILEIDKGLRQEIKNRENHKIAYIANSLHKSICVVDLTTEQYLGKIFFKVDGLEAGPNYIAITPDLKYFIVTRGSFGNDILIIDSTSFELVKQIPGGWYNNEIIVNPARNEAYILSGHYEDNGIYVLNLTSFNIFKKYELGHDIGSAAISPNGDTLYVTTSKGVSIIDLLSDEIIREAPIDTSYWKRIVVHPTNSCIYVVKNPDVINSYPTIQVLNVTNGEIVYTIHGLTNEPTWDGKINALALDPKGDILFTVSQMNLLTIIDTNSFHVVKKISTRIVNYYGVPDRIYFDSQGIKAYFIYWGGIPIDTIRPEFPSKIGVMDLNSYKFTNFIELDGYAGASSMVIL